MIRIDGKYAHRHFYLGCVLHFPSHNTSPIYPMSQVIFAMAWNQRSDMSNRFRLAIGSFIEEYNNKIQVCDEQ